MTNTVIKVENLTKEYRILHENKDPYKKFSDTLIDFAKKCVMPWKFFNSKEVEMFKALNDVNFEIKKGEKIAIIGRNGAGKSTLLKVLSRITEPTEGTVKIKGRVASLLEVGTGFHPELTGRENIFLNGAILGMTKKEIQEKFDDIVEFSGCEKFLDTPVKRYSSGMRVRLGFAVAAHLESEILIVDEVLAVGDAEFQKKCLGKMEEISKGEGRTIIFVSHNMSAVQNLCDKGIVMDGGEVKFVGDISDSIKEYNHLFKRFHTNLKSDYATLVDIVYNNAISAGDDLIVDFYINFKKGQDIYFDFALQDSSNSSILMHHSDYQLSNKISVKDGLNVISMNIKGFITCNSLLEAIIHIRDTIGRDLIHFSNIEFSIFVEKHPHVNAISKNSYKSKTELKERV